MIKRFTMSALLLAMAAAPAEASCTLADIGGSWTLYNVAELPDHSLAWVTCSLTISKGGLFNTKTSLCANSNGARVAPQGQIKVSVPSVCAFSGTVAFPVAGTGGTIQSLTLTMNKEAGSGIGTGSAGVFAFNMVKVK